MAEWQDAIKRIQYLEKGSAQQRSNYRHLISIFEKAKLWDLNPDNAAVAKISNLREIVAEARAAIGAGDKKRLDDLFSLANSMSITDLRKELRGEHWQVIPVKQVVDQSGIKFLLELNKDQFERIKNATRRGYVYTIKE